MRTDEWQRGQLMLRCDSDDFQYDDDESSRWNERCLQAHLHSDAQVSNETEKECAVSVVKNESYLEGEASSPLYRRVLVITVSRLWQRVIRDEGEHM